MATKNVIDTNYPIEVAAGGQGRSSATAYAVVCGGTTTTNPLQSVASVGTAGQALTSNGAGALPTFQTFSTTSGSLILLDSQTASASSSLVFSTGIDSTYDNYYVIFDKLVVTTAGDSLYLTVSVDGGGTYVATGYFSGVNTINHNSTSSDNVNVNNGAQFRLTPALSTGGACMALWLSNLTSGGQVSIMGDGTLLNSSNELRVSSIMGYNSGSLTVDAFKIAASTGNLTSGTVYLYGLVQ